MRVSCDVVDDVGQERGIRMNRDPLSNPEAYETDEEIREQQADTSVDTMPERGRSPLEGIDGPEDFAGGKLGQAPTPVETAASGKDWNVTGPVEGYGHANAERFADEPTQEGNPDPQSEQKC